MSNRTEEELKKIEDEARGLIKELLGRGLTMQQIRNEITKRMENKSEVLHMREDDSQSSRDGSLS